MLDRYPVGHPGVNQPNYPLNYGQVYGPQPLQPRPLPYPVNPPVYQNRFHHNPNWYHNPHHMEPLPSSFQLPSVPYDVNGRRKAPGNSGHYPQFWHRPNTEVGPVRSPQNSDRTNEAEESSNTRREATIVSKPLPENVGETEWRTRGFGPCTKSCAEGTVIISAWKLTNEK